MSLSGRPRRAEGAATWDADATDIAGHLGTIRRRGSRGRVPGPTRFRDKDGKTRAVTATGTSKAAAERALREAWARAPRQQVSSITAETRLIDLANLWITGLATEGRIEQTTINEYAGCWTTWCYPVLGGLSSARPPRVGWTGSSSEVARSEREPSTEGQGRPRRDARHGGSSRRARREPGPAGPAGSIERSRRPGADGRGPGRGPRSRAPWTAKRTARTKGTSDMADIIDLMLATGCRIGEILALRWGDVGPRGDLSEPHGQRARSRPRPERARIGSPARSRTPACGRSCFRVRHRSAHAPPRQFARPNENDAVFATRNGTWQQVDNVERRWRQIRKDTGLEWVTPHTFRKTVATLISEAIDAEPPRGSSATPPASHPRATTSPSRRSRPTCRAGPGDGSLRATTRARIRRPRIVYE